MNHFSYLVKKPRFLKTLLMSKSLFSLTWFRCFDDVSAAAGGNDAACRGILYLVNSDVITNTTQNLILLSTSFQIQ